KGALLPRHFLSVWAGRERRGAAAAQAHVVFLPAPSDHPDRGRRLARSRLRGRRRLSDRLAQWEAARPFADGSYVSGPRCTMLYMRLLGCLEDQPLVLEILLLCADTVSACHGQNGGYEYRISLNCNFE